MESDKIVITGAAGLVGQNLIPLLKLRGWAEIVAIDKDIANTAPFRQLHSNITIIEADLARDDGWQHALTNAGVLICCHAQIGGLKKGLFEINNIVATRRLLEVARLTGVRYLVHISSASVNSAAVTLYSESKKAQEALVDLCDIPKVVLRPTLMFGRFDRKNLGWLARFMAKTPVFPVPGNGRYPRQPLYIEDFCNVIVECVQERVLGQYNISGLTKVNYIDLVLMIKETLRLKARIIAVPYGLFWLLLKVYGLIDREPPFTTDQLKAFTTPDEFEVFGWPKFFRVTPTPLNKAIAKTFLPFGRDARPRYS
jgi:nucleoside-diphosphate-sugar epimerase